MSANPLCMCDLCLFDPQQRPVSGKPRVPPQGAAAVGDSAVSAALACSEQWGIPVPTLPVPGHDWLGRTLPLFLVLWEKRDLCIPSLNAPNSNGLHTLRANLGIQQIYDFSGKMHSVLQAPSLTWREVTWGRLWGQQPLFLWDETGCLTQALVCLVENWSLAFFGFVSPHVASVCSEGFSHWFCSSQGDWGCLARDGLIVFSLRELRCLIRGCTFIIPTSSLSCAV